MNVRIINDQKQANPILRTHNYPPTFWDEETDTKQLKIEGST